MLEKQQLIPMAGAHAQRLSVQVHKLHLELIRRIDFHKGTHLTCGGLARIEQGNTVKRVNGAGFHGGRGG